MVGIASLVCIGSLIGLLGCDASPAERLAEAGHLVTRQDLTAALIQLKSLVQDEPDSAEARLLLGQVLLDGGDPVAAKIELQRALTLGLPAARVAPALARSLLALAENAKLLDQFGSLLPEDPPARADLKSSVAQAQATLGDLGAAHTSLRTALQAVPDHEPALLLQARLAAVAGDMPAAVAQINALLARDPKSAAGWLLKGDLLGRLQADPAPALQAYRQSQALRPGHPDAYVSLIALHLARGETEAARHQFDALRRALPEHPQTLFYGGQLALASGDLAQARDVFQRLLRAAPEHPQLLLSAGAVELQLKAPAQAEVLLSKALLVEPDAVPTRRLLAQCQLALGQPAKALVVLEPLLDLGSGSGTAIGADAAALALAAQAQMVLGKGAAAAALFEQAARLKPDDTRLRTALAMSRLANGQRDQAISELQAAAASDTGTSADLALVSAQMQLKHYDAALAAIAALERKQPDTALAPHLRGQVQLLRANTAAARQSFEQAVARDGRYFPPVAALAQLDLADQKPEAAHARYRALLLADPHNPGAHLALAALAAVTGAPREEVTGLLEEAVKANPTDLAPRLALIDHHLASFNPKAAGLAAQAALARMPDQFELLGRLGRCQLAASENQQAIITYSRMVTLQPNTPAGYLGQAEAQLAADDLSAAAKTVRRAIDLVPGGWLPAQRLGIQVALRQKQPAAALALAREVQQQRPEQAIGLVLEAEIELQQQRWDAAVPLLRKALTRDQPGPASVRLHHALLQAGKGGKASEAEAFASGWLKDHPKDAVFRFYLGDLAVARKDLPLAEQRYRAVLALQPGHALSLNNIAWLLLTQHQPGALAYAKRAAANAPNQPAVMDTLAQAYAAEGQVTQAIALQQRVLVLQPDNAFARLKLARYHAQANDKRQAKAELDRLAALGDRFAEQAEVTALRQSLGGR